MMRRSAALLLTAFAAAPSLAICTPNSDYSLGHMLFIGHAAEDFDYQKKFPAVGIEQEFRPLYSRPNTLISATVEGRS